VYALEAAIWGGTQITWTRVVLAVVVQSLLITYLLWAMRFYGR
jgi:hypothetical protein